MAERFTPAVELVLCMATEYRVRPATWEDRPRILKLVEHTWSWGDYIPRVLDSWLSGGGTVFVCVCGDELVGMVHLSIEEGGLGWLEGARVAAAHRNRGVATMMAQHAVEHAAALGLHRLRLAVAADNAPSIRHVGKVGFRPLARFRRMSARPSHGPLQTPQARLLEAEEWPLVLGSKTHAAYAGLYYRSFRWLDLDEWALGRLSEAGRAIWVGDHFLVHSSDYEEEGGRVAEVGYAQLGEQDLGVVLDYFGSKSYSKVDFVVPEGLALPAGPLVDEGEVFIVFELKL